LADLVSDGGLAVRQTAHVTSALGRIDRKLTSALAADDPPGLVDGIQQLARIAELIGADGYRVPQVMTSFGRAVTVLRQRASLSQLDVALPACEQAAGGTASPLLKAAFQAAHGNLLAARAVKTAQLSDLDAAVTAFEHAVETLPEANPIMPVYRQRLAELRRARAILPTTPPAAVIPEPSAPVPAAAQPAPDHRPDHADNGHPPWTPEQAKLLSALGEPMTGDVIPLEVRRSRKFRWIQRGLLVLCLACTGNLTYAWLHGGTFLGTGDAIAVTLGFWLTYIAARFGIVYKRPG
jgi:hypothetical protein